MIFKSHTTFVNGVSILFLHFESFLLVDIYSTLTK